MVSLTRRVPSFSTPRSSQAWVELFMLEDPVKRTVSATICRQPLGEAELLPEKVTGWLGK